MTRGRRRGSKLLRPRADEEEGEGAAEVPFRVLERTGSSGTHATTNGDGEQGR